jgi:hypothetical protein
MSNQILKEINKKVIIPLLKTTIDIADSEALDCIKIAALSQLILTVSKGSIKPDMANTIATQVVIALDELGKETSEKLTKLEN